jgi:[ribosomal protein S18]-alanine N-acetyltransferase
MIEPVAIGPIMAADAEAIAAMDRACLQDGWEAATVARLVGESTAICRVARSQSGIAGFVLCRVAADECEVLSCAVDADFRRRGAARLLLQAAFEEAVRRGGRKAFLEVAADNAPALALYSGFGFRNVGRRPRYYRRPRGEAVDALVMRRAL